MKHFLVTTEESWCLKPLVVFVSTEGWSRTLCVWSRHDDLYTMEHRKSTSSWLIYLTCFFLSSLFDIQSEADFVCADTLCWSVIWCFCFQLDLCSGINVSNFLFYFSFSLFFMVGKGEEIFDETPPSSWDLTCVSVCVSCSKVWKLKRKNESDDPLFYHLSAERL